MINRRKRPQHIRISKDNPYYPMSYKGYITPARLAMAEHLDRCLGSDEYIYFIDSDSFHCDIRNLKLVSHKELTKLNEIRRIVSQMDKMSTHLATLRSQLAEIEFNHTPCSCPKCMRSRESRQAGYKL